MQAWLFALICTIFALNMSITSIIRPFFLSRVRHIERYAEHAEEIQREVLRGLLRRAQNTEWGRL